MKELRIKYDRGKMVVILNNFFPTSRTRLKKLLKVIDLDYEHRDELIEHLKQFFSEQIPVYKAEFESNGKKYLEYKQLSADTGRMVKSKKRPSGVRLSDEELKQEKERLNTYKDATKKYLSAAKKFQRGQKQYSELLEYLTSI
ncbi:hypothetical protein I6E09_10145 [Mediterraneibacter glycyrrhizinilyticus]|uniref:hypothetical protein n=1 Tax=Mediterraneibacter glycyrrhizinilyticus TaxID=342942 RepID=UPI00265B5356|nr:hypothetical protein [Mediterraneibacter glycyrrhizinilyticus]MCF2569522.1 hypothetical protein [Mediterraneibacter glycyrrhizinilyticus]